MMMRVVGRRVDTPVSRGSHVTLLDAGPDEARMGDTDRLGIVGTADEPFRDGQQWIAIAPLDQKDLDMGSMVTDEAETDRS